MPVEQSRSLLFGALALALWCAPRAAASQELPPHLDHQALTRAIHGEPVVLRAVITSPIGRTIAEASAFVRLAGVTRFSRVPMRADATVPGLFFAKLPEGLVTGDFDYYLEAFDADGNGPARAGSPEAPLRVSVTAPAPKVETAAQQVRTILVTPTAPSPEPRSHGLTGALAFVGGASAGVGLALQLQVAKQKADFAAAQARSWSFDTGEYKDIEAFATVSAVLLSAGGAMLVGALISALVPDPAAAPPPARDAAPAGGQP
jgi:hypothetical protein